MNRIFDHRDKKERDVCYTISLTFQAKRNFRDILFDLSYGAQPTDRVVFNAKLAPTKVVAGLKMLGCEGKLKMERNGKVILVEGTYNQDKLTMNGEFQNLPGDYFLKVDLTSTLKALKTVKLNLVHKITQDQAKLAVNSQVRNRFNSLLDYFDSISLLKTLKKYNRHQNQIATHLKKIRSRP